MISKNTIKLINSLAYKKYRNKEGLFLVEADKSVTEILQSDNEIYMLAATAEFINSRKHLISTPEVITEVSHTEIKKLSHLKNPQNSIAICRIPNPGQLPAKLGNNLSVYLDDIQDPGNLGTIIRVCDWFGIEYLFCSPDTVDIYSSKVIQASMGSFNRIKTFKADFEVVQSIAKNSGVIIYGTFMSGTNVYNENLPTKALLVMGNEGNGIKAEIESKIEKKISIPNFSKSNNKAESLNVAMATAIICSEFKRKG
ncbi:MAG: RNA methyltransferase [Bacteroidota bacterium]